MFLFCFPIYNLYFENNNCGLDLPWGWILHMYRLIIFFFLEVLKSFLAILSDLPSSRQYEEVGTAYISKHI